MDETDKVNLTREKEKTPLWFWYITGIVLMSTGNGYLTLIGIIIFFGCLGKSFENRDEKLKMIPTKKCENDSNTTYFS